MAPPEPGEPERAPAPRDSGAWGLPDLDWRRPDGGVTRVRFACGALDPSGAVTRELLTDAGPARLAAVVGASVAEAWPGARAAVAAYCAAHRDVLELVAPPAPAPRCRSALHQAVARDGATRILVLGDDAARVAAARAAAARRERVALVHLPTTVRAQADAGLTGAGEPSRADAVLCDFELLRLGGDPAARREGLALAVEAAVLRDPAFLRWLEHQAEDLRARSVPALAWAVHRTAQLRVHAAADGTLSTWPSWELLRGRGSREARAACLATALTVAAGARGGPLRELDRRGVAGVLQALGIDAPRARAAGAQVRPSDGASPAATSR